MLTDELKKITYPEHQAAEKKLINELKQIRTAEDYIRMLSWMYSFYAPLEAMIQKYLTPVLLPDIHRRSRAGYLLRDIRDSRDLEIPRPGSGICRELPPIGSADQAIGALYVLEGSTLGGRIIAGILQSRLGANIPTSYFNGYGEENAGMWQTYKDFLDQPRTREQQNMILETAKATFITFKNWIGNHELQPQL
jgi:heme oxygenase